MRRRVVIRHAFHALCRTEAGESWRTSLDAEQLMDVAIFHVIQNKQHLALAEAGTQLFSPCTQQRCGVTLADTLPVTL